MAGEDPNDARPQDAPEVDLGKGEGPARPSDETMTMRGGGGASGGTGSADGGHGGSGGGTDATPTGSFRLPAPGPAPWEAPQNGGSHGATESASPTTGSASQTGPTTPASGFGPPPGGYGGPAPGPYPGQYPAPPTAPGWAGTGTLPPPPPAPPAYGPGGAGGGAPGEARPLQAVLVALLNLSCLGLGYVLLRHWIGAALCWAATAALLLLALPADADGVPQGVLIGYGAFLLAAAADGARRGLRARLSFGATVRRLALPLAVVLLAAPVGGAVAYGAAHADAREEARQQALLARLAAADALVTAHKGEAFAASEGDYVKALEEYDDLGTKHGDSRAGKLVPDRLDAYYKAVAAPYASKSYCEALAPLKHLKGLTSLVDKDLLGERPAGVEEPLAHSLYECGAEALDGDSSPTAEGHFGELANLFPGSPYTAKVRPAVRDAVRTRVGSLTDSGDDHCATTEELRSLRTTADSLRTLKLTEVRTEADRGVRKGVFACGTQQFGNEQFTKAAATMEKYAKDYPDSDQAAHARSIAIAAQIADKEPEAGKKLPPAKAPGGARMTMVISNDAPDEVELLYTGPVTGKITLRPCGDCRTYDRVETVLRGFKPCSGASSKYPKATVQLPAGTYHLLQKRAGSGFATAGDTKTSKAKIEPGYSYTNCLYVTKGLY
ncbi:hypothetical protein [Streptomyces sp. CC208A]|uniref:hypothetical protein n=1 Tax=Streptomyces sp. CC208A TaxID=3044573 RepID=UPI0024A84730|nr:hypothetical protein [Streptomyces sp. CC208A]